ncbi:hypothetical protein MAP00_004701 [Monascus purpureus]|nr:hypothetical protein MAP00_004701 [Monascus purpureus]
MTEAQVVALLYFSHILAEEIDRSRPEFPRSTDTHRVAENTEDAFVLVEYVLHNIFHQEISGRPLSNQALGYEAVECYYHWACVRGSAQLHDSVETSRLESTTNYFIQTLNMPKLSTTTAQNLIEMDWGDSMFTPDHIRSILEYLISDFGTSHIASLLDGDFDPENMTYLELLLAYSTFKQRELFAGQLTPEHEKALALIHTLFKAPGYAAVEDLAAPLALEWWTEVADDLQEIYVESTNQTGLESAKRNLARAALDCFGRIMYPNPEELQEWSSDDRSEFGSFRRDACDFLLAVYPILGVELIQVFQERAKSSLASQDWQTFEAAIFCIAQLSEAVDENQHADECLNAIFFYDGFARLCDGEMAITDRARQTLVDMFGKYQSYFERTHSLLPRVLTFLFVSLDIASCALTASRSISYLCRSCRNALTLELPAFINQFESFRFKPTATTLTMEKVLEGIAAIIQTLPTDEEKAQFLERILVFFQEQAQLAREEAANGLIEPARGRGQFVLRCLACIGKGLRTDGEIVIEPNGGGDEDPYPPTFWNTGNGAVSQSIIMQCMELLIKDFPFDIIIVEAACDILKAGYTEKAGPFVFPPIVTVNFVKSIPPGSPGTDMVMGTASAFLASHSGHPQRIRDGTVSLIVHIYNTFCWMHETPQYYDPEVANSGIDFLTRLLPKYHPILFTLTSAPPGFVQGDPSADRGAPPRPPILQAILNFTLLSLQGQEPLPLRSASQFWASVLGLPIGASPHEPDPVQNALKDFLPALCRVLITQIAGRCARSDLEYLCEVLRKVIFKHQGSARPHLAATLAALEAEGSNQNQHPIPPVVERERFLASVIAARGAKSQTIQLAHTFWVKCRGTGFDYLG